MATAPCKYQTRGSGGDGDDDDDDDGDRGSRGLTSRGRERGAWDNTEGDGKNWRPHLSWH